MGLLSALFAKKEPPVHVNDDNFADEVLGSELPVVLDVWSPSCAPCKQLEEVMFALRKRYDGRVKICELSSANAQRTAAKLRISATPTVIYFNEGREKDRVIGFRSSVYHQEAIEELFGVPVKQPKA